MNKKRMVMMILIILLFPLLLPRLAFLWQDHQQLSTSLTWTSPTHEVSILKEYPLIASIYDTYQKQRSANNEVIDSYTILPLEQDTSQTNKEVHKAVDAFDLQINRLLQYQVFPSHLLTPNRETRYKTTAGYLTIRKEPIQSELYLIDPNATFTMDDKTGLITELSFTDSSVMKLSEKELKTMTWNMIKYLKLDTMDDWIYIENRYESYRGRIQVYWIRSVLQDVSYIEMRIGPLGQNSQTDFQIQYLR